MNDSYFKCPKCGSDWVVAYEMVITGPIVVDGWDIEPKYGKGLNFEVPETAEVRCPACGFHGIATDFLGV